MFSAINSVEPPIIKREQAGFFAKGKRWYQEQLAMIEARVRDRLGYRSNRLRAADWLDGNASHTAERTNRVAITEPTPSHG